MPKSCFQVQRSPDILYVAVVRTPCLAVVIYADVLCSSKSFYRPAYWSYSLHSYPLLLLYCYKLLQSYFNNNVIISTWMKSFCVLHLVARYLYWLYPYLASWTSVEKKRTYFRTYSIIRLDRIRLNHRVEALTLHTNASDPGINQPNTKI